MFAFLLKARLRWYVRCTGNLVARHWQWFVLALVMLPMGVSLPQLFIWLGYPLRLLLGQDISLTSRYLAMAIICTCAIAWAYPQRKQILGLEFSEYFNSLPIGALVNRAVDVVVIAVATSIILLPIFGALLADSQLLPESSVRRTISLLTITALLLITQLSVLRCYWRLLAIIPVAVIPLSIALHQLSTVYWAPGVAAFLFLMVLGMTAERYFIFIRTHSEKTSVPNNVYLPVGSTRLIYEKVFFGALLENKFSSSIRIATSLFLAILGTYLFYVFKFDSRIHLLTACVLAVNAFVLSGFHRELKQIHLAVDEYTRSLPLNFTYRTIRELASMFLLSLPSTALLLGLLIWQEKLHIAATLVLVVMYGCLLAILRVAAIYTNRHGVILSAMSCTLWVWLVFSFISESLD